MNKSCKTPVLDAIDAITMYRDGKTLEMIASKAGCDISTVAAYLRKHKIAIRKRGIVGITYPIGTKIGAWIVISETKHICKSHNILQKCRCKRCGYEAFVCLSNQNVRKSKSCQKCKSSRILLSDGGYDINFIISSYFIHHIKKNVPRRNKVSKMAFNINPEYLISLFNQQHGKCAISGMDLLSGLSLHELPLSLDRIDANQGYIKGNVQWVHKDINMMKQSFSNDRFIGLCSMVAMHQAYFTYTPRYYSTNDDIDSPKCPKCGEPIQMVEGCMTCSSCGYSKCS